MFGCPGHKAIQVFTSVVQIGFGAEKLIQQGLTFVGAIIVPQPVVGGQNTTPHIVIIGTAAVPFRTVAYVIGEAVRQHYHRQEA